MTDFQEKDNEEEIYIQPEAKEDVFDEVLRSITAERVQKALEKLSPEDRLLIKLRDIDGLSYEEIASVLQKPVGTVKSRLHYARKRLGNLLKEGGTVER